MKVQITRSNSSKTGYELVTISDDGQKSVQLIDKTYPNEPYTLVLPQNASNRKYFNSKKVEAAGGTIELEYKESKTFGPRTTSTTQTATKSAKPIEDYLNDEDKATYLALVAKANKAREIEKAKQQYEEALKLYNELLNANKADKTSKEA